ncbi:MAG: GNAT family N-acetyltransferase [Clostridia bacterium]|nr:GNAT family N-acetyltransferase [Clostridia bacterium]
MTNPYIQCPVFENNRFRLRFVENGDTDDLFLVYSDKKAWPIFNSDNCTSDFRYTKRQQMEETIAYWREEYQKQYYVRWAVVDNTSGQAVGTVELFNRQAEDFFTDCGLLRLDLRSDYETAPVITEILNLLLPDAFEMFHCRMLATKIPADAAERKKAVEMLGFAPTEEVLVGGHDGKTYGEYHILLP